MSRPVVERWLPGLAMAGRYRREWLGADLSAGLVMSALLIPVGMGYAQVAGLPPETGLYATIVPLVAYALVGPSRVLVLGPDSTIAPIIAVAVVPLAVADPARAVALGGLLALLVGTILVAASLVRLGFITDLLSKPIRVGYLNGIALSIFVSQAPEVLGLAPPGGSALEAIATTARQVAAGATNTTSLAVGGASIVVILALRRLRSTIPGPLVAVAGSMAAVALTGVGDQLSLVGALPRGLPAPALGGLSWSDVGALSGAALGIALIAFADNSVLSRTFAARRGESVDVNVEMRAIGAANLATALTGGFPISASSSRTPVAEQAGARTQLVGIVSAAVIMAFVAVAPGATELLPSATLAAVVVVAAASLVDVRGVAWLVRVSPIDGALCVSAFLGVALVGVLQGIVVAVALSFVAFVIEAWRPYRTELVRVQGVRGYHDRRRHPEGRRIPGLVIVRFDAPLFFANAGMFDSWVRDLVRQAPDPVDQVVLAAEPITRVDTTAVDALIELDDHLAARGIRLVLAEMKGPVKDQLRRYGLDGRFSEDRFSPTVGAAVDAYRRANRPEQTEPTER